MSQKSYRCEILRFERHKLLSVVNPHFRDGTPILARPLKAYAEKKTYREVRESKEIMDQADERLKEFGAVPLEQIVDLSHLKEEQFGLSIRSHPIGENSL
ncbi:hypothetical protein ACQCN2_18165 [Brevibacillus ginsengisoli]|uniref:hypothetical protein n=1 Tax=Brevibacillus ginsengisoli TaxID=363854 RepID=UPI003CED4925